jgi:hypothetical protein
MTMINLMLTNTFFFVCVRVCVHVRVRVHVHACAHACVRVLGSYAGVIVSTFAEIMSSRHQHNVVHIVVLSRLVS